jgi:type IV pilus assembly protein PilA
MEPRGPGHRAGQPFSQNRRIYPLCVLLICIAPMRLLHFLRHHRSGTSTGFTLIELLVVIVIGGILSAIALPSFLNQRSKAEEAEGKVIIGAMNRAQQRTYIETQSFTTIPTELMLGVEQQTKYYTYSINGEAKNLVTNVANPRQEKPSLRKTYAGVVGLLEGDDIQSRLCESSTVGGFSAIDQIQGIKATERLLCPIDPIAFRPVGERAY